jgi:predicted aspartyl protease
MIGKIFSILALLVLAACAAPDNASKTGANCTLIKVAALPATVTPKGQILVPVGLNGVTVLMQVDTGANQTVLYAPAVKRLGLEPRILLHGKMRGIGGEESLYTVSIDRFTLGESIHPDKPVVMAVIDAARAGGNTEIAGLLGADYLKHFDLEFDLGHRAVNLFVHHPCAGQAAYWPHDVVLQTPFSFDKDDRSQMSVSDILIPISINDRPGSAIFDSGASVTAITWIAAEGFGITPQTEGVKPDKLSGIGERSVDASRYVIPAIKLGDETIHNMPTAIYHPVRDSGIRKMLFGVDFILRNRVYIAYDEHQIYFTPYRYRMEADGSAEAASK